MDGVHFEHYLSAIPLSRQVPVNYVDPPRDDREDPPRGITESQGGRPALASSGSNGRAGRAALARLVPRPRVPFCDQ